MKKQRFEIKEAVEDGLNRLGMSKYTLLAELEISDPTFTRYQREGWPKVYRNELVRLNVIESERR